MMVHWLFDQLVGYLEKMQCLSEKTVEQSAEKEESSSDEKRWAVGLN
jgi:hypothetical protein